MSLDFTNFPGRFSRLVLSGGGSKGLAILGALHYIHENNGLNNIKEYWGTSIGSVIILLLSIGYTPFEIFHEFFMQEQFLDTSLDLDNILENTAFCPIELFGDKIRYFVEKKLEEGVNLSFLELTTQFNKNINIIGSNTDEMKGECFCVQKHPDMKIIEAIEISCNLPFIFTKKKYNNINYVDGGFINNYPINLADNSIDYCLGIGVFGDVKTGNNNISWVYKLLQLPVMELYRDRKNRLSDKFTNVELEINDISVIEMSPSNKKKIDVFSKGYKQCREILLKKQEEHIDEINKKVYINFGF